MPRFCVRERDVIKEYYTLFFLLATHDSLAGGIRNDNSLTGQEVK